MAALVSVLMPVRDGARFLRTAIDSVLAQTLKDFELLVIDDGSRDATPAILAEATRSDARVRVITQAPSGLVVALNRGIAEARAPLVARLDADDIAGPARLARQIETMRREPDLGLLGSYAEEIDADGRALGARKPPVSHEALVAALARGNPFIHSTVMFRAGLVRALGGFRAALEAAEDYDLWLRIAEQARVANLPETLVQYRTHAQSVTGRNEVRMAFSVRMARRAAAERQAGRPDPLGAIASPPDWRKLAAGSPLAGDARDFRLLEFADPEATGLDPSTLDPSVLRGLGARLDHGERRLAQYALVLLLARKDRPSWMSRPRLLATLFALHPARAIELLARGAREKA
jgi:hypothetical protein